MTVAIGYIGYEILDHTSDPELVVETIAYHELGHIYAQGSVQ